MQTEPLLALAVMVAAGHSLPSVLTTIVQGLAAQPGVALARMWLLQPVEQCDGCAALTACRRHAHCLRLVASAGTPQNFPGEDWSGLEGSFRRIPLQAWRVGVIGATGQLAGLNLYEISSGQNRGKHRITKRGLPGLRRILYIAALRLVKAQPPLHAYYGRLRVGRAPPRWWP